MRSFRSTVIGKGAACHEGLARRGKSIQVQGLTDLLIATLHDQLHRNGSSRNEGEKD